MRHAVHFGMSSSWQNLILAQARFRNVGREKLRMIPQARLQVVEHLKDAIFMSYRTVIFSS